MRKTTIPVVIGALETVNRCFKLGQEESEIGRQIETIRITALFTNKRYMHNPESIEEN